MKYNIHKLSVFFFIVFITGLTGCEKYLDERPNISLVVPSTLADVRALIDGENLNSHTGHQVTASDNIFVKESNWIPLGANGQNVYRWIDIDDQYNADWSSPFSDIFYANTALSVLNKLELNSNQEQLEAARIKGSALFYRADKNFQLLQNFSQPYVEGVTENLPGIPIRLTDNVQRVIQRSTIKESYDQVIKDLMESYELVPDEVETKNRPTKTAVNALLARVYLAMSKYPLALEFANKALATHNHLLDYSTIVDNPATSYVFPRFNNEVIYHSQLLNYFTTFRYLFITEELLSLYDEDDLRAYLYFFNEADGNKTFKNSYTGDYRIFSGLATDELMLIKAECLARDNQTEPAMQVLNSLLEKRWRAGEFEPYDAANSNEALQIILTERRKELVFRGQRWSDLRRLNLDPEFAVTIHREINGTTYSLPPNDLRYVFLIPFGEIELSSIEQNPR